MSRKLPLIHKGMSMRDARRAIELLGGDSFPFKGELRFTHPSWSRNFNLNYNRKTITRHLATALQELCDKQNESSPSI